MTLVAKGTPLTHLADSSDHRSVQAQATTDEQS